MCRASTIARPRPSSSSLSCSSASANRPRSTISTRDGPARPSRPGVSREEPLPRPREPPRVGPAPARNIRGGIRSRPACGHRDDCSASQAGRLGIPAGRELPLRPGQPHGIPPRHDAQGHRTGDPEDPDPGQTFKIQRSDITAPVPNGRRFDPRGPGWVSHPGARGRQLGARRAEVEGCR